eukprot:Lithocolla_globosa_v1_NODE_1_length_16663_cov_42.954359.p7 type:complete len:248 gc:universal NODE_1_length_16663_cov_42.954359:5625-6368(+)
MSNIRLTLDSSTVTRYTSDDFTTLFTPQLILDKVGEQTWSVALESVNVWYTWFNINTGVNDTIKYYNGSTWKTVVINPGIYALTDINAYLKAKILANGDDETKVNIAPNYNTLKCDITLTSGYQVDLQSSVSALHVLLGFDSQIVTTTKSGENAVDITAGVDSIAVHVDILDSSSYNNGIASDVIYNFVANKAPGSLLEYTPRNLIFYKINTTAIQNIRVYFTAQDNTPISFNGESTTIVLILRKNT